MSLAHFSNKILIFFLNFMSLWYVRISPTVFRVYETNIFPQFIHVYLWSFFSPCAKGFVLFFLLSFIWPKWSVFSSIASCFWIIVGKAFPSPGHRGIHPCFLLRFFISYFIFRCLINLEFIFLYSMRFGSNFLLFSNDYLVVPV